LPPCLYHQCHLHNSPKPPPPSPPPPQERPVSRDHKYRSRHRHLDLLALKSQGCQFRFGRCFVFSIGMECFSFGVFRRAISGLYCSYIYIYIYIYYSTNIIQIQDKLIINYAMQTQCQTNIILKFKIFLNSQD